MSFTAGQIIGQEIKRWPLSYEKPYSEMKAANHIFCVIGGGGTWHPNGFVIYDPDMPKNAPERRIPRFNQPFQWYPLSEDSALVQAANGQIRLNSSFAALAKDVAKSIINYGETYDFYGPSELKRQKDTAARCLKKLNNLYPDS